MAVEELQRQRDASDASFWRLLEEEVHLLDTRNNCTRATVSDCAHVRMAGSDVYDTVVRVLRRHPGVAKVMLEVGWVIQVGVRATFSGRLAIVTEVHSWGVSARVDGTDDVLSLAWDEFDAVGPLPWPA
ncbi:MAG: hypothetical protein GY913_21775 [Proteobacteria bacterium]|nr:hypothetical protein [Actinomycetes bacterium]MCP4919540.1 hypothetical protein [Pseudomonadota bacterium]